MRRRGGGSGQTESIAEGLHGGTQCMQNGLASNMQKSKEM
jgi:hypothetical protein